MATGKYGLYDQSDIQAMSDEQLMEAWTELGHKDLDIRAMLELFSIEHQRREEQARLAVRLGTLSDAEKAALTQYIESQSADAGASVGEPGGK